MSAERMRGDGEVAAQAPQLHPQEIAVVWRGAAGVALPTREFDGLLSEAKSLGDGYVHALFVQVARQRDALGALQHPRASEAQRAPQNS